MARGGLLEVGEDQDQLWYKVELMEVEEVKNGILVKCQKVFDNGLGK